MSLPRHWGFPVALVCLVFGVYTYFLHPLFLDDAYISLTYARNLANGEGLHWSGQRVEGYTNFLFVLLSAIGLKVGIPGEWNPKFISFISYIAIIYLLWKEVATRYANHPLVCWHRWLAILFPGCSLPLVAAIFGGLESVFFALLCLLSLLKLLHLVEEEKAANVPRNWLALALLLLLCALTRPEGLLLVGCTGLCLILFLRPFRLLQQVLFLWLPLGLALCLYAGWKYAYFGDVFPNTFYAKATGTEGNRVKNAAAAYLLEYLFNPPLLFFFSIVGAAFCLQRRNGTTRLWVCLIFITAYLLYVISVQADYMPYFRFILPVVVFSFVLFFEILAIVHGRHPRFARECCVAILFFTLMQPAILREQNYEPAVEVGILLRPILETALPSGSIVALNIAGYLPYYVPKLHYIDMLGLNDRHIARAPARAIPGALVLIGHQKADGRYVLAKSPDIVLTSRASGLPRLTSDFDLVIGQPEFQSKYQLIRISMPFPPEKKEFFQIVPDYEPETNTLKMGIWVRKDRLPWFKLASEQGFRYREVPFSEMLQELQEYLKNEQNS